MKTITNEFYDFLLNIITDAIRSKKVIKKSFGIGLSHPCCEGIYATPYDLFEAIIRDPQNLHNFDPYQLMYEVGEVEEEESEFTLTIDGEKRKAVYDISVDDEICEEKCALENAEEIAWYVDERFSKWVKYNFQDYYQLDTKSLRYFFKMHKKGIKTVNRKS